MKLYIILLISGFLLGMEQPPLMVVSTNGLHRWNVSQDAVAQMGTLQNQNSDLASNQIFLSPAVDPENFTALLPLLTHNVSAMKALLKAKNTIQVTQIACDADCLGAQKLLEFSLRVLQKRVRKGAVPDLPETLQSALVKNVVDRDPYIASILFRTIDHARNPVQDEEVRICGIADGTIQIDTNQGKKAVHLNGNTFKHEPDCSHIIPAPAIKKTVIFNESEILLVNDEEQRVIQKWNTYCPPPMVLVPYTNGVFAILPSGISGCWRNILNYRVGAEFTSFKPFETCPTALALSSDQNKLVVGSLIGQLAIYDVQTLVCESEILEFVKDENNYTKVRVLAIDPKNKYIACDRHVGTSDCELGVFNLKKKTYDELVTANHGLDDLSFDKTRPLLYAIDLKWLTIWNIKDKKILHKIKFSGYDGPPACKLNTLVIDDAGAVCTVYGRHADRKATIALIDTNTLQELEHCSLPAIAFLARVSKKIADGQQVTSADEHDFKTMYRSLPKPIQSVIAKHMGWKDWIVS